MNKTTILIFTVFIAVGYISFSYKDTILASLQSAQPILESLQSKVTQIQASWAAIPEPYKGYANLAAVGGIPTALMMFFAWAKMRWQKKALQTEQLASQKISGLNTQLQSVTSERDLKVEKLQAELEAAKNSTGLQTSLAKANTKVTEKEQEIKLLTAHYEGRITTFEDEIKRLEDRLRVKQFVK